MKIIARVKKRDKLYFCIVRYTHSMTILEYKSVYNVQLEEVIKSKVMLSIVIHPKMLIISGNTA